MKALIDYENVGTEGLDGIKGLSKKDEFLIFYNDNSNITFDLHRQIERLECKKDYQKISSEESNALDFLLSTILGRFIAIDSISSYAIISKDSGYDVIIKYWKAKGINIGRYSSLRDALGDKENIQVPSEDKETGKVVEALFSEEKSPELDINQLLNTRNPESLDD